MQRSAKTGLSKQREQGPNSPHRGNLIGDRTPRHQKAVKLTNRRVCQLLQFPVERTNSMRKVREHVFRRYA